MANLNLQPTFHCSVVLCREIRAVCTPMTHHYTLFPLAHAQIPRYWSSISILDNGAKTTGDTQASLVTDARWKVLQNSLLGLFCASLGSMEVPHTTSPAHTFPPIVAPARDAYTLSHATLLMEHVSRYWELEAVPQVPSLSLARGHRCAARAAQGLRCKVANWHGLDNSNCNDSEDDHDIDNSEDDLYDGNGEDNTTADGHNDRGVTAEGAMTTAG
ncbi:hypothetical protein EDB84DRAFT_1444080 [Lactarius hengduanensis]|nr:hypothetical protein EDB84DRAFT_1444080 [Lactarius hengduanensis]